MKAHARWACNACQAASWLAAWRHALLHWAVMTVITVGRPSLRWTQQGVRLITRGFTLYNLRLCSCNVGRKLKAYAVHRLGTKPVEAMRRILVSIGY